MAQSIVRLGAGDYDELLDFLDRVFGKTPPNDFRNLLPALYQPTDASMRCNYALREDGKLVGNVGVFPIDWRVGGYQLQVAGIGGVATDPEMQGRGIMQKLMAEVVEELRLSDNQLSYLGGQRQRYGYFGYERCGIELNYDITRSNLKHAFRNGPPHGITLSRLEHDDPNMDQLRTWHAAQPNMCVRPTQSFYKFLRDWCQLAWRADDENGQCVGYVVGRLDEGLTSEIVARDDDAWIRILRARVEQVDMPVRLPMDALPTDRSHRVASFAEAVSAYPAGNWRIFDWAAVLNALIKARHDLAPLPAGHVVLGLSDQDLTLAIKVDGKQARCEEVDLTMDQADLVLDEMTAMRVLFGPVDPARTAALEGDAGMLAAWCPLPLAFPKQDHV